MTYIKINYALRKLVSLRAIALASLTAGVAGAQTIAITGAKVYPVSSEPIENGTVLIRDGKIVAVGSNVTIPSGAQVVRVLPALNLSRPQAQEGLDIIASVLARLA